MFPPDALPPLLLRARGSRHRHRARRRVLEHAAAARDARERRRHRHALRARRHPARHAVRLLDCRPHARAHRAWNLVRFHVRFRRAGPPGARAGGCVPPPHCERHDGATGLPVLRGPLHQRDAGTPRGLRGHQSVHGGQRRRRVGPVTVPSMRVRVPRGAVRQAACAGDRPGRPHHTFGDPRLPELRLLWVGARDSRAVAAVIDVKLLRAAPGEVRAALARRGDPTLVRLLDELEALDMRRRALTGQLDQLKADRNEAARADARAMKEQGALPAQVLEQRKQLGGKIAALEAELRDAEAGVEAKALLVPNLPSPVVPDVHTREHGYVEVGPPFVVRREMMQGTGQLPKFEADMYRTDPDDLFLVPTAEVPLVNLHRDEIVEGAALPLAYTAYTPCFRREAGAAGKDTRGLLRVHQFDKVELVRLCRAADAAAEHEAVTRHAEAILQRLELPYRVVLLAAGDLGFASARTYDLEVWAPGVGQWLEVSSSSTCTDFQARRANIRCRPQPGDKPEFVHTLNASGLALPRTIAALLETHQQPDASVTIPRALVPYVGTDRLVPPSSLTPPGGA